MTKSFSTLNRNTSKKYVIDCYNFITDFTEQELIKVSKNAKNLPIPTLYGTFIDQKHYLDSVDLLVASTRETEHRREILFTKILPRIKSFKNLLDIGVGNGELTKDIG
ncbi:hypothetical protein NOVO_06345 [Rickettsiales bacterium Ac37b]|nr:hypothetical protein NOVO_06345 [Rickettsiales bacterium Ac37b]